MATAVASPMRPSVLGASDLEVSTAARPSGRGADPGDDRFLVLVAEDDPTVRHALEDTLLQLGFGVVGAVGDGEAAVAVAEDAQPDVVVMDVRMPRLDGIEAARRIKELAFGPEVVLVSVHGDLELREAAEAAGVCAYLPKDCPVADLSDAIRAALLHRSIPFTS